MGIAARGGKKTACLSVVLPVYNEYENLEPLVDELLEVLNSDDCRAYAPFEILLVDDGSTDRSREAIRDLVSDRKEIRGVFLRRNFGQSAALSAGFDHAKGDVIVAMDADRQNDPRDIPRLLKKYEEGYDCVSGWRQDRNDPLSKRLPSTIQTYLARLTGPDIHDFGCTLKVYSAESIRNIDLYGEGHRYIPAKLHDHGYAITEIPVNHRHRESGSTKYGSSRLIKGFVDLLFHVFWNRFSTRPLHIFGGAGILFILLGGMIGIHALYLRYLLDVPLGPRTPRLIFLTALILFGAQLLVFGLLAEMLTRMYYRGRKPYRVSEILGD